MTPAVKPDMRQRYHVVERDGWLYVASPQGHLSGPWRYRWEAQEEADALNAEPPQ